MKSKKPYPYLYPLLLLTLFFSLLVIQPDLDPAKPAVSSLSKNTWVKPPGKNSQSQKLVAPARFMEYHRLIRTRAGASEPAYEAGYRWKEFQKSLTKRQKMPRSGPLNWKERGPGNVGGRTRSIWVDPTDATHLTWFAGSVSGGVWKTENGGVNWRHLTKDLSNLATSVLTGSAVNPDVLYVGTGEGYSLGPSGVMGNGMWKSTDRGETWLPLEKTLNNPKFAHTMRIAVNQENEQELVVASRRNQILGLGNGAPRSFIHKSTDGGQTWVETWQDTLIVQQVIAHPGSFDTLFAAVNNGGVFRSFDAGLSWSKVFNTPSAFFGRIELAISPTDPNYIYLAGGGFESRLFRSEDGGDNWWEVKEKDFQNRFGNWMGFQSDYNNTLAVHPFDPHTVYVGGQGPILKITVLDSEPNAATDVLRGILEPITDGYDQYSDRFPSETKGVHVDHHHLNLIPINENTSQFYILNANDGGIAFSMDSGATFTQTGDTFREGGLYSTFRGYNTSQFYGIDKMNGADRYVGGTQDNNSWISGMDPDAMSTWVSGPIGDGFEPAWHYRDSEKILESVQQNNIYRSDDGGGSWRRVRPPGDHIPIFSPFFTRLANSKIDPDLVFSVTRSGVVRSLDFANTWEIIPMPPQWQFSGLSNLIHTSLASQQVVWTGLGLSHNFQLFVSDNGGSTFSVANVYEEAELGPLSGLTTHPVNEKTAYALFSAADAPKILRTRNMGSSWEDISGFITNVPESNNGFPDVATYTLVVMPFDTNQIWVGTEIGLFESLDGGLSWQYADNGLPPVAIWQMKIVNDEVVLATHGRGVWTVALPELEGYEPPEATALISWLEVEENGLGGRISGAIKLRSDFDSVFVEARAPVDAQQFSRTRLKLGSKELAEEDNFELLLEGLATDTIVQAEVSLLGYKDGVAIRNVKQTPVFGVEEEARTVYFDDFDEEPNSFARLDFTIHQEDGFDSRALHSLHPYEGFFQTYLAVLSVPIIVAPDYSLMSFDEIALIEPGEEGSVFGDTVFWDFVAVEGTRDLGQNWEIIEGYDARWSATWVDHFTSGNESAHPGLIKNHTMDLASVFSPGDTIFLRFRLETDLWTEGWGWMIDNLSIQENLTAIKDNAMSGELSISTFPNPASNFINLSYTLAEKQRVKIDLYSVSGRLISSRIEGLKPAGEHQMVFDVKQLEAGLYLFRFQTEKGARTIKWMKM